MKELIEGASWLGIAAVLVFFIYYHPLAVNVRNAYLHGQGAGINGFLVHYAASMLISVLLFLSAKNLFDIHSLKTEIGRGIIWFACFSGVYIVSAELFHLIVVSRFHAEMPGFSVDEITGEVNKIGLPILWGVCSFTFMFLGMNFKIKEIGRAHV